MLAWLLLLAQVQAPIPQPVSRDRDVLTILNTARSLPPEFSADIQLKLAASALIPGRDGKLKLIEEAFRSAPHAPLPYAYRVSGMSTDAQGVAEIRAQRP